MEEEVRAVRMDLLPGPPDVPGHPMHRRIEHDIKILPDVANLGKGFVPEGLQQGLGVRSGLTIAKQGGAGLRCDRFDIDTREKVRKERHVLLHIRPHFMDQEDHFDHQVGIGRIGHVRFLDSGIDSHRCWICKAQFRGPDGDHMGHLAWRFWREARAKLLNLGMVGRMPWSDETSSAKELVGGIVLNGPFDLAIREVIEPLEQEDPEVDTQRQFSAKPPLALGRGAFQIRQYHIRQGLPRDDVSQLDERMGGGDLNGHGLHTAGGVESKETDAHGGMPSRLQVILGCWLVTMKAS